MGKGKMNQKAAALKEQTEAAQKSAQAGKAGKPAQKKGGRTAADKIGRASCRERV